MKQTVYDAEAVKNVTIGVSDLVLRQKKGGAFSYYDGPWEDVLRLVAENWFGRNESPVLDGVVIVPVPSEGFFCTTVQVEKDTKLRAVFGERRKGEKGFVKVYGQDCQPLPARYVNIVCYHRDLLLKDDEIVPDDVDWEIVSINASAQVKEPMHPVTMARNFLDKKGGSKADYSAQQFAESIWYWMDKVQIDLNQQD